MGDEISPRERIALRYCSVFLMAAGFWFLLHGGLSLLGGFGFERMMLMRAGRLPSNYQYARECLAGTALLFAGLALFAKIPGVKGLFTKI